MAPIFKHEFWTIYVKSSPNISIVAPSQLHTSGESRHHAGLATIYLLITYIHDYLHYSLNGYNWYYAAGVSNLVKFGLVFNENSTYMDCRSPA